MIGSAPELHPILVLAVDTAVIAFCIAIGAWVAQHGRKRRGV